MHAPLELADVAADVLARVRARAPRVHCITNTVAQPYTANFLLAAGAVPSMTIAPEEIGAFVAGADALLVNLGTFDAQRRAAIEVGIAAVNETGKPWVLDPVFIQRTPARAQFARTLIARKPAVVRLNAAEFAVLAVDDAAGDAPERLAKSHATVIALTGSLNVVTDGVRRAAIGNGDPLMRLVTALGCAASALVGAALAVETDAWLAVSAVLLALGVAGEMAAQDARGPGGFASAIIDAFYSLDRANLRQHAKVS